MPEILSLRGEPVYFTDARAIVRESDAGPQAEGVLPLALWQARTATGAVPTAVWLAPGDDLAALVPHLRVLRLVALELPKAADGRAYSLAALLRTRHGYRGELRAIGDVAIDQLYYLRRVGFDSAQLASQDTNAATLATVRAILQTFDDSYQSSTDQPLPLFRRRLLGGAVQ